MTDATAVTRLADYRAPDWLISQVALTVTINDGETEIAATLELAQNSVDLQPLVLDGEGLETLSVAIDGVILDASAYAVTATSLTVLTPPAGGFTLETRVRIKPESNTQLEGLYKSGDMYCTQCEAEGFRRITWFLDRPDVLAVWNVCIDAPANMPTLLSNGNRVSDRTTAAGRRQVDWSDPHPKPAYLFALVAGDLVLRNDRFTTASGREVDLHVYTRQADADKVDFAIASIKQAMAWDERRFGREYDLDVFQVVAVGDFNMGAMENKGLNIFNTSCVLATPDVATDDAYERVEAIIGHEYFHNWSGNRVTCRDWFQLSLKEGFTVYRDAEFTADLRSRPVKRIQDVDFLRTHQFAEDAGPTSHPVRPAEYEEISNFYTVTIYEKGAEVVRMLETLIGRDQFRAGSDLYFERFDGQAVTCDDFVDCMQQASGRDLTQFRRWYSQNGTPQINVSVAADGDGSRITFRQQLRDGQAPFHMPMPCSLYAADGELLEQGLSWELDQVEQSFSVNQPSDDLLVSVNQGFAAPVRIHYALDASQRDVLARHDLDGFNRWDAGRQIVIEAWAAYVGNADAALIDPIEHLFDAALAQFEQDPALTAEIIRLPDDSQILDELGADVDPVRVRQAGDAIRAELGRRMGGLIQPILLALEPVKPYQPGGDQAAKRSLWCLLAQLLAHAADDSIADALTRRFVGADNLTDRMNCMTVAGVMARHNPSMFQSMLTIFHADWQHEPLLLDQWFQQQARFGDFDAISALLEHADFSLGNPNRARSVLGVFTRANPEAFHAPGGYELLAGCVASLDVSNPQIGARLVIPLTRYKNWSTSQRERAIHVLKGLDKVCQSADCREVIGKALK